MIQLQNVTTALELATAMCRAVKEQKWHTFVGTIAGKAVQVKVYGLFPQIFMVDGLRHTPSRELKTQKAMKEFVLTAFAFSQNP